jgi:hypothetical protein
MQEQSREYTHKNSSAFPWSSFGNCPFAAQHGSSYSAAVHVCKHDPSDAMIGDFNGIRVLPGDFSSFTADYFLRVTFTKLVGLSDPTALCVVARVKNARGEVGQTATWNCSLF